MELLWNDDPEELLLELGFGCDEPDLSGRIPARFINYQSQARGINLQVFLEAQKSRIDLENPDVSNRFRQLEVLQEVSVAFSSLAGPLKGFKDMSPEARERRRRMGMLFRRASKKSLSQLNSPTPQDLTVATAVDPSAVMLKPLEPMYGPEERKVPFKRVKLQDTVTLSPFVEEEGTEPDGQDGTSPAQMPEGEPRVVTLRERFMDRVLQRKKSLQMRESFEMEELCSFDEGSTSGVDSVGTHFARGLIRVNSCQSDSSGFLEDPLIPSVSQDASPAPDLIKALSALSGGSTDSHSSDMPQPTSVCSPNAATEHFTGSSNNLQIPSPTLDCDVTSQFKEQSSQENGVLPPYNDLSSPESLAFEHQETEAHSNFSGNGNLQKSIGMEEKTVYFVSSFKISEGRKYLHSTDLDEFPPPRLQKSVVTKEAYQLPVKKKPIVVTHFLSCQDSVEDLNMNAEERLQYNQDGMEVESIISNPDGSRLQSEDVYLETEIDWQDITQGFEDSQSEDFQKVQNFNEDYLGSEKSLPKVSKLTEIESLDDVFETSVDESEVDAGDVEAFLQEMHSIGHVYWAEPIHIVDLSPQSGSFEDLDTFQEDNELEMESDLNVLSSTGETLLPNESSFRDAMDFHNRNIQSKSSKSLTSLEEKPSKRSISVQMRSNSSSHIVYRKDVPYMDNPKHKVVPRYFILDTSNPFRAVQSWTNLHIQYNSNLMASKVSNSAGGNLNRPEESYWSPCHESQSDDCLHRMSREKGFPSVSMDTGLWADDEEVDRTVGQSRQNGQTCCTCDHTCNCCKKGNQHMMSQWELEGLLLYLQKFRSVLSLMEEQLTEEQAAVFSALTKHDRQCLEELLRLRQAVRQEALELELQLLELVHHHDHSLTTNMLQLLDEQSLLCSQLRLCSPGLFSPLPASLSGLIHKRTVATQCTTQQGPPHTGPLQTPNPTQMQTDSSHQGLDGAPAKTDKRHLVGFLQRVPPGTEPSEECPGHCLDLSRVWGPCRRCHSCHRNLNNIHAHCIYV